MFGATQIYLYIALLAWSMFGAVSVIEKFLLDKPINNAAVYTFYTGVFSAFTLVLFGPFARVSSWPHVLFDLSCGVIFLIAQYCLYRAIMQDDISRIIPITGAMTPIFSLLIVNYGLHLGLSKPHYIAFALLVLGTFMISYQHGKLAKKLTWPLLASFFLAVYYSLVKSAYTPFKENYAWVRAGSFIAALVMFAVPEVRQAIRGTTSGIKASKARNATSGLFISKEVIAGLAFIILNYAITRGNPAVVNALQGFEFAVILVLVIIISNYRPDILKENSSRGLLLQKFLAIFILVAGLAIFEIYH